MADHSFHKKTEKWITVKDVGSYCMVSSSTVRRWIKEGKMSARKLPSGHYRITTEDFRTFLKQFNMAVREEFFQS